jgi:hypothetical protein
MFTYKYLFNGKKQAFKHTRYAYIRAFILSMKNDDPVEVVDEDGEVILSRTQLLDLKTERREVASV